MLKPATKQSVSVTWRSRFRTEVSIPCLCILAVLASYPPANAGHLDSHDCSSVTAQPSAEGYVSGIALNAPIKLLSWNIQKSHTEGWEQDLKKIGDDRDLVLIQEASIQADTQSVLLKPMHVAFAAGYATESESTGVLTLSAVPPSLECSMTSWEPWLGTPKATSVTKFAINDSVETLMVINLHAINFTVGLEEFTAQIDALSPLLKSHQGPALLAGDFNTWNDARQAHIEDFVTEHQLQPVSFTPDDRSTFWDMPLDHIYLRGLKALEARTIAVDTSDHNPMLVTLEIEL